ncbi:MAG TPA: tetratricopeptide repeat protein [Bacteroidales bacterium]|nr:tetratricopeptide repeat protein [Bacteroidales bacterium]
MVKNFILIILAGSLIFAGCNKFVTNAKSTEHSKSEIDFASFDRFYVEGLKQKLMGNAGEALKYFEQCLKINPANDAVYYQMAQILAGKGDFNLAKNYIRSAIKIDGNNIWYVMMLSQMYYQEKNIDSAIIWYQNAVKIVPDNDNVKLTLGNLYVEKGDYDNANKIFEAFDERYGVNDASTLTSVRILMSKKKYEEAKGKIIELLKQNPEDVTYNGLLAEIYAGNGEREKAIEVYKTLEKENPDNPQVQLSYAEFLAVNGSFDDLFSLMGKIALNRNIDREDKLKTFAELSQNGDIVRDSENRLIKSLVVLESVYPDDDVIPLLRPDVLIKQGKEKEAADRLEELIKFKPGNYFAWEKLLFAYLDLHDYQKLLLKGEECATKFNMSFVAKVLYANAAIETSKFDLALNELRKAEILAGDNSEYKIQVLTMRADIYYREKEYDKAFSIYEEALKLNSEDLTVMNNYAYYLAEQNIRLKEAEDLSKKVVEKEGRNTTFLDTYGWVLYKRGKLGEAARVFEAIFDSGEKPDAEWYEHYGFILKKQRKYEKAIENWEISMTLDPANTYLKKEIENCEK